MNIPKMKVHIYRSYDSELLVETSMFNYEYEDYLAEQPRGSLPIKYLGDYGIDPAEHFGSDINPETIVYIDPAG